MVYGVGCLVALDQVPMERRAVLHPLPFCFLSPFDVATRFAPGVCPAENSGKLKKFRAIGLDSSTKRLQQAMVLEE
jgi:hypothetical protein